MKKNFKASLLFGIFVLSLSMSVNAQWECVYWYNIPQLNAVRFKDFNHGITAGSKYILRTSDNGTIWDTALIMPNYNFRDIVYADSVTIIAVGYTQSNGIIARSTDDGNTWDTLFVSHGLLTISFPSKNVGYAGGYDGIIYKTLDKGNHWTPMFVGDSNGITSVFFVNDTVGFAAVDTVVLKTTNGGNSWTSANLHKFGSKIFFPSDSIGYLAAGTTIFKTFDMGTSWSVCGSVSNLTHFLSSIFFVNDMVGYGCGFFEVAKTIDGGLTWTSQSANPPSWPDFFDSEMDVYFLNQDTGFVVGTGTFYRTTIGGEITGVNNYEEKPGISIFPNPLINSAIISFNYKQNEKYIMSIHNMSGQKVMVRTDISSGQIRIDRKGMSDGLYFFQLQNSKGIVGAGKFIIE